MDRAIKLFDRLTEVEKICIRSASPDGLDYLADVQHRSDLPNTTFDERSSVLQEVKALIMLESTTKSAWTGWDGVTWKF